MDKKAERRRIHKELKQVGVTNYGLKKFGMNYVIKHINEDEHIHGVAYGRYQSGPGLLILTEGMLVATDQRVIFLDHKPGFTDLDEITYDMVGGVRHVKYGPFNTVTMHTRMGDFSVSYVNAKCARIFTEYIESRRISRDASQPIITPATNADAIAQTMAVRPPTAPLMFLDQHSLKFLKEHDVAVLSSVDRKGNIAAAVIYYIVDQLNQIYIVTKTETHKAKNIIEHSQIAITIFDATTAETLSIKGRAEFEMDDKITAYVFSEIVKPRNYQGVKQLPPVAHMKKGAFTVLRITPHSGDYIDYKQHVQS